MKRYFSKCISLVLSLVLSLPAQAIPVLYFFDSHQELTVQYHGSSMTVQLGGMYDNKGAPAEASGYPFEAIIIQKDGSAFYGSYRKDKASGVPYYELGEEVKISEDGKTASGPFVVAQGTNLDTPVNKNVKPQQGSQFGAAIGRAAGGAISSGVMTGSEALFLGFVLNGGQRAENARLSHEIAERLAFEGQLLQRTYEEQKSFYIDFYRAAGAAIQGFSAFETTTSYEYKTTDPEFKIQLDLNRQLLESSFSFKPAQRTAKLLGLQFNTLADEASYEGQTESAEAFLKYARGFADIAVGLDPISGTIRSVYEAFTGKNLITNESLSDLEWGFAVVGAVSFGFGNKIGKGVSALLHTSVLGKMPQAFEKAIGLGRSILSKGKLWASSDYRAANKAAPELFKDLQRTDPSAINRYVGLVNETKNIKVRLENVANAPPAEQLMTREALDIYHSVKVGERQLFRLGTEGHSKILGAGDASQHWASNVEYLESGFSEFADKVGAYSDKFDFIQTAKYNGQGEFIVRRAPQGSIERSKSLNGIDRITMGGGFEVTFEKSEKSLKPLKLVKIPDSQVSQRGFTQEMINSIFNR